MADFRKTLSPSSSSSRCDFSIPSLFSDDVVERNLIPFENWVIGRPNKPYTISYDFIIKGKSISSNVYIPAH